MATKEQIQISEKFKSGQDPESISKELNIKKHIVLRVLECYGLISLDYKGKIDPKDYVKIVELYNNNLSSSKIGEMFNVTHGAILQILEQQGCQRRNADDTHRIYPIREDYFNIIDTQEKAYILGFTYADGCNHLENNYFDYDLSVKDADILKKISERIYLEKPHDRIRYYSREKEHKGKKKVLHSAVLSINSKHMCNVLNNLGCEPRKSFTAKFPEWLQDKTLQRHFIRGYYDGDGGTHVSYKKGGCSISKIIGTSAFIQSLCSIIRLETSVNIYVEVIRSDLQRLYISGNQQVKRFLDWLYLGSTIHLDRKHLKYLELINMMENNPRTRKI